MWNSNFRKNCSTGTNPAPSSSIILRVEHADISSKVDIFQFQILAACILPIAVIPFLENDNPK